MQYVSRTETQLQCEKSRSRFERQTYICQCIHRGNQQISVLNKNIFWFDIHMDIMVSVHFSKLVQGVDDKLESSKHIQRLMQVPKSD